MKSMKNLMIFGVTALVALSVTACKPTYEAPVDDPVMTTAPADAPYEMDFDQLNDDVIDSFSKTHVVFPFVKSMEISGDNDTKNIEVDIDIQEGVADYAVQVLLSDVTKKIDNNAYIQDFRIKQADDTQFGSVYDIYSYTYKVTCGGEALYDETIQPGTEIPLDPSVDGNKIMESVANEQADEESTEAGTASLN
ncbi:MAG: hypothetical protein Q4Q21_03765 [Lachnospiraceae bacterium]|nr:hypothetical protein [Lachnospiraceae bacterium]